MHLFSRSVLESTLRIACWRPSGRPPLCTSSLDRSWRAFSELHAGGLQAGLCYVLLLQVCLGKHPLNCMLEAFRQASTMYFFSKSVLESILRIACWRPLGRPPLCTSSPGRSWRAPSELHAGGFQAGLHYVLLLQVCLGEHPPNCMLEAFRQASAMYLFSRSVLESTLRIACWRLSGRPPLCTSSPSLSWRAPSELHAGGFQAGLHYVLLLQVCLGEHPPNCMLEAFRQASAMYLFSRSVLESTLRIACWRLSGRPPLCTSSPSLSWRASSELHAGGLQAGLRYVSLLQVGLGEHPPNCMLEAFRQAPARYVFSRSACCRR